MLFGFGRGVAAGGIMSRQINLINPALIEKKKLFSSTHLQWTLGMVLAALLVFYATSEYRVRVLARQAREAAALEAKREAQLASLSEGFKPRQKSEALAGEIAKLEAQIRDRNAAMAILQGGGLDNSQSFSGYMTAFARQIVSGLWLTGFSISGDGKDMVVEGKTLRPDLVPLYISHLNNETVMHGVTFASLEMQVPRNVRAANYLEFTLRSSEAAK